MRSACVACARSQSRRSTPMRDLFGNPTLVGIRVKLDRPVDRDHPCCRNVCTVGAGRGPHAGELICSDCGQHRGWLSKSTAHWIETVVARLGVPTTPIVVRKEEEEPTTYYAHRVWEQRREQIEAHDKTEEAPPTEPQT